MRVQKLTFAALAVVAGLSLTACQNGEDDLGQVAPSSASSASSASGGSGSGGSAAQDGGKDSAGQGTGGQGTSAGNGSEANSKVGKCRTDDLDITATDSTIGGDTEGTVAVEFKNGGPDCVLSGYAGIDLKTNAGSLSAERTGEKATPMTLKNGKSVYFGITYPLNTSGGSGVRVTGLVVTPPDETKSFSLEWPGAATLPATDGSGSQVKVGPMGSAGQGEG
ncbi:MULTISPECIES: DUF4232 domain-containing protein [unclassified Streptomyces]|uniref:DUF4232 domain-containing protein n=1 Tax=unclassified Streptomyces TaxID=2593676 RepID=UPI00081B29D7|nr:MULTISPECIES: DUF4232 domain-containing protein [unclassified Streptomyces]MYQ83492.1 DUF4232 domain-containing protein [Streptomyces sp. SID4936]SCD67284.1 Protein of unknown function [Streptomyces sp. DvalAA-43]